MYFASSYRCETQWVSKESCFSDDVNIVPTNRAHLIATQKKTFHRHPYCVTFHFPSCSSLRTIIRGNSLGSTKSTQILLAVTMHMDSNTSSNISDKNKNHIILYSNERDFLCRSILWYYSIMV